MHGWKTKAAKKSTSRTLQVAKGSVQTYIMEGKRRSGWWLSSDRTTNKPRCPLCPFLRRFVHCLICWCWTHKRKSVEHLWDLKQQGRKLSCKWQKGTMDRSSSKRQIQSPYHSREENFLQMTKGEHGQIIIRTTNSITVPFKGGKFLAYDKRGAWTDHHPNDRFNHRTIQGREISCIWQKGSMDRSSSERQIQSPYHSREGNFLQMTKGEHGQIIIRTTDSITVPFKGGKFLANDKRGAWTDHHPNDRFNHRTIQGREISCKWQKGSMDRSSSERQIQSPYHSREGNFLQMTKGEHGQIIIRTTDSITVPFVFIFSDRVPNYTTSVHAHAIEKSSRSCNGNPGTWPKSAARSKKEAEKVESIEGMTVLLGGFVFCLGFRVLVFLLFLEQNCSLKNTRRGRERKTERERWSIIVICNLHANHSDKAPLQEKSTQYRCVMMCTLNF